MKLVKQTNNGNSRLLLFFAGWAASPALFRRLQTDDQTDVWICYDYRDLRFDEEISKYKEIHLIAWSMGVRMAELTLNAASPITQAIAINGTSCPIDDRYGIPENIFLDTLENITADGMKRFNRRMCGSRENLAQYEAIPSRPLDEIREELQSIYTFCHSASPKDRQPETPSFLWTKAIIGTGDRIFPVENLRNYWNGRCPIEEITAPHYPFYLWKQWNEL